MKSKMRNWGVVAAIGAIVVGLAMMPAPSALAVETDPGNPGIYPPDANVYGMSYGDWTAAWWQYALTFPWPESPLNPESGTTCDVGQPSGPVLFLAGAGTTDAVTRTCTVPAGTALLLPIINVECSTVEPDPFHGGNAQELRACAAGFGDGIGNLLATIDGKQVHNLGSFRVQSPVFDFINLPEGNFLGVAGGTSGSSLSDGYWLMIKPLSPGAHAIHFEGAFVSGPGTGFSQNVTYNVIVQ